MYDTILCTHKCVSAIVQITSSVLTDYKFFMCTGVVNTIKIVLRISKNHCSSDLTIFTAVVIVDQT